MKFYLKKIYLLLFFILLQILFTNQIDFKYRSYSEIISLFENLAKKCPRYLKIDYAQNRYNLPYSHGECEEKKCQHLIVFMTDFFTFTEDRPHIYISGLLHGNEVIGGNTLSELAIFLCENPHGKIKILKNIFFTKLKRF